MVGLHAQEVISSRFSRNMTSFEISAGAAEQEQEEEEEETGWLRSQPVLINYSKAQMLFLFS